MAHIAFITGVLSLSLLLGLAFASLLMKRFQFFPPPSTRSWQYWLFWCLFRLMVAALVLVCVADYSGSGAQSWPLRVVGVLLTALGFGMAFRITAQLGWGSAHGEANQLVTDGWFQYSRNPIYVFSVIGMLGLALLVNSAYANWLLAGWALLYLLAPFAEEAWLAKQFDAPYLDYLCRVPRFIGWRRRPGH